MKDKIRVEMLYSNDKIGYSGEKTENLKEGRKYCEVL